MRIGEFSSQTGRDAIADVDDLADADRIPPHTRVASHRQLIPQIAENNLEPACCWHLVAGRFVCSSSSQAC
jgi:hypothetical protein